MARYILIDNGSGFIFGDSADLNGKIFTGSPLEYAAAFDASIGEHDRSYEEATDLATNETGYRVYRADVGGSEAVPVVTDGQDQEMIAAVERDCKYVTTIRCYKDSPQNAPYDEDWADRLPHSDPDRERFGSDH